MKKKQSKRLKNVIIPEVKKPEVSLNEAGRIIGAMASLQATEGWAIIVKILNDNLKYLESAILDKIDPLTKSPLTEAEIEICRIKRLLNIDLRDTPKNYGDVIKEAGEVPEDFDPYFKNNEEIQKAKNKPNQEG